MSGTTTESITVRAKPITNKSAIAAPYCSVQVFPYEGGTYTINPGTLGLMAVGTSKSLRGGAGSFTLTLAATGPQGPNVQPRWDDIITPMSVVAIEMGRGTRSEIVMIGVVNAVGETAVRGQGTVSRGIVVSGYDFGFILSQYSFFNLAMLLGLPQSAIGALGFLDTVNASLTGGTLTSLGQAWYDLMVKLVMSKLMMTYQNNQIPFSDFIATSFEDYPNPVTIPMASNFLADETDWNSKFLTFFQPPWYEFFMTTAPVDWFPGSGNTYQFNGLRSPPATINLVARVNPLPRLTSATELDTSRWTALPTSRIDAYGPYSDAISFSADGVRNFYGIYPQSIAKALGADNANIMPFTLSSNLWVDPASIARYGYRPEIVSTYWFCDPGGDHAKAMAAAGQGTNEFQALIDTLTLQVASYYEPMPLMASGQMSMPLRPDVIIGSRFVFTPEKFSEPWMFYIEAVEHNFVFGQGTQTTLTLSRGLPESVYKNTQLLTAIHSGNAQRAGGVYKMGLPAAAAGASGLESITLDGADKLVAQIQPAFSTPQSGQKPPAPT